MHRLDGQGSTIHPSSRARNTVLGLFLDIVYPIGDLNNSFDFKSHFKNIIFYYQYYEIQLVISIILQSKCLLTGMFLPKTVYWKRLGRFHISRNDSE